MRGDGAGQGMGAGGREAIMRKPQDTSRYLTIAVFAIAVLLAAAPQAMGTEWDFGAKLGYESNVNRSLDDAEADTIFTAYAAYDRSLSGESRVDWTLRAALSGSAYASESDLNQVTGTIAPGISVFLSPVWSLNVSPFLRGKAVSDWNSRPSPTVYERRCRRDGTPGSTRAILQLHEQQCRRRGLFLLRECLWRSGRRELDPRILHGNRVRSPTGIPSSLRIPPSRQRQSPDVVGGTVMDTAGVQCARH